MNQEQWDIETDLLVVGAGPAGMTAALVGSIEGLDVTICEKGKQVGGTGATSAGTLWIPGNSQGKEAGFNDSREEGAKYLESLIGPDSRSNHRSVYLRDGPSVIDYLARHSDVTFESCGTHPDYRNNIGGAALSGRAIIPKNFDGRKLGSDFSRVKPPIQEFLLMGGMMVGKLDIINLLKRYKSFSAFVYSARIVMRYLIDRLRYKRGTRLVMGNALIARLFYSLRKRKVSILFESPIEELVKEEKTIKGAVLRTENGKLRILARKGVILATGGFSHNAKYRRVFMPEPQPLYSLAAGTNAGEGVSLAEGVGGIVNSEGQQSAGFWTPVSVTKRTDGSEGLFPHLAMDRAKPGLIAVNAAGRRFVNEAVSYHDFVEGMYRSHKSVNTMPAWLICEASFITKYGLGAIHPETRIFSDYVKSGYLKLANTLEELALKTEVDASGLIDSVSRNNRFAISGTDDDFGKGDLDLNRFNGDLSNEPNPCLGGIETGPFAAMAVWPADIGCSVGIAADTECRVLGSDDKPIPGLYTCGNDMASIMSGAYPGPGTTLGPAIVFGWRVAMQLAGKLS